MNSLPSKKVLSILILTVAIVASIIIAFGRDTSSEAINFVSDLVAGDKVSIPENPNWQAELGNIAINVDPVQEDNNPIGKTDTDIVSRSLISNYLTLKQNNTLNQETAQNLVDKTVTLTEQLGDKFTLDTELNIIPDAGNQSITDYGNNLGNIFKDNKPAETKNELEIITKAVKSRDPAKIDELDSIISVYQQIVIELSIMPVPQTFAKAHLDMTNGMKKITKALTEIKTIFSDPIRSLAYIQLYKDGATMFTEAMKATIVFIGQNKIIYKQGSGGYYLLYNK